MSIAVQQRPLAGINLAIDFREMQVTPLAAEQLHGREGAIFFNRHSQGDWGTISLYEQQNNQRLVAEMALGRGTGHLISAHTGLYGNSFHLVSQVDNGWVTCTTLQLARERFPSSE